MCRIVNVGLCVCAVCNWDGSRQSNNHCENSTKLPGYLWGKCFYNISFNLWAQYNLQVLKSSFNHSTLDIYSSSETCGPWRDQAAVHDATFWNQQSQQDAAVQYSTRSKQLFYFFPQLDFQWKTQNYLRPLSWFMDLNLPWTSDQ